MKKIVVGMSGGVDSSVTAYLLKEQGYEVIGATMRIWQEAGRESQTAEEDARRVAERLGIPHYVIDLEEEFHRNVVGSFTEAYLKGETPSSVPPAESKGNQAFVTTRRTRSTPSISFSRSTVS